MNEISTQEQTALSALLADRKALSEIDVDKLERLMKLHSVSLYNQAMNAVQSEMKPVFKGDAGYHSKYANMERIANMIQPIYIKYGFSISSSTEPSEKQGHIVVAMVVMHTGGHSNTHRMEAPIDWSENMKGRTKLQGVGSTETYLKRRLLTSIFGIMLTDKLEDTDGELVIDNSVISKEDAMDLVKKILDVGADKEKFLAYFKVSKISELPAERLDAAKIMLDRKANA